MSTLMQEERMSYLTTFLMEKIEEPDFTIQTGPDEFAWVSPEDQEVVLVRLQPARFTVAEPAQTHDAA